MTPILRGVGRRWYSSALSRNSSVMGSVLLRPPTLFYTPVARRAMPGRCRKRARCLSIGSNKDGAVEKTRTSKPFRALAPQASASTNSATTAGQQRPVGAPLMRRGGSQTRPAEADKGEGGGNAAGAGRIRGRGQRGC